MFERFTERARRALFFARYESSQFGSPSIETEHLLLGLVRDGSGLTQQLFARSRISLASLRQALEERIAPGDSIPTTVEIPFSEAAKRVLLHAVEEADVLGDRHIGTEHLLLGLLREEGSLAATLLLERGLTLGAAREWFAKSRNQRVAEPEDQETLSRLFEENARLRQRIRELEQTPHAPLQFRDNAYWLERGDGTNDGPFCSTCWDIDRRLVRKMVESGDAAYCEFCKNSRR